MNKIIVDANQDENGLHFKLEGGWWFSLFNNISIIDNCEHSDEKVLAGRRLRKITDYSDRVVFDLEGGVSICMSLQDKDYNGPESMNVWAPDGRIFVSQ
ncbi:hypothetical protein [Brevundimonas diminuta]|uniref:hypothetical protein n=1 Tax=Brevundimonas diminuta TaxID=293 RepID=UPI0030F6E3BE